MYGSQISIHHGKPDKLPYGKHLFNLIISEKPIDPDNLKATFCTLRPFGGVLCTGSPDGNIWNMTKNGPLEGSGQWTHQYGNGGNASYGGEALLKNKMQVQWFPTDE